MYIKSIHVSGFKTYQDAEVDLDSGHNVFVGRNGSGKSNFFEAIRFVFGDDIEQLRSGDSRQALLHQGKSETNVNASVAIVIDNSDQRIPNTEGTEIKLMRMVGLKKDEYFINGRRSTKSEVTQMLDMAGLSSSNPYYVVAQGKVAKMSDMTDEQRLQLLQDVAGTRVYESRRAESVKILEDSKAKRQQITDMLGNLDAKLDELRAESKELDQYMEAERKRRAIEYVLYSAELEKSSEALKELEDGHQAAGTGQLRAEADAASKAAADHAQALAARKEELARTSSEAAAVKKSLPKMQERRVKLGERVATARAAVAADKMGAAEASKELAAVQEEVAAKRKELAAMEPEFQAAQAAYDSARQSLASVEQQMNALSDKAGRAGKFKSKKERDAYLMSAIGQHRGELTAAQAALAVQDKEVSAQSDKAKKSATEAAGYEKAAQDKQKEAAAAAESMAALTAKRAEAISKAHTAKARLDDCEKRAAELTARKTAAEAAVFANMPLTLRRGLEEVAKLSDPSSPNHIAGIHGPLYELIKPAHDRYNVSIEAVAGAELFNVVVADEQVAAKVLNHLVKNKAGRITMMPLSRLKPIEQNYPQTDDSRPLINFIHHDPMYAKAVKQQFGRVLLCKTSEVASKYAREKGFIGVTLEGDTANKSGALTGGYISTQEARLKNVKARQEAAAQLQEIAAERASIESEAAAADSDVRSASAAASEADDRSRKLRDESHRLGMDAERKRREVDACSSKAEQARTEATRRREQATLLRARIEDLEREMTSEMSSKLSSSEQAALEKLTGDVELAKKKLAAESAVFEGKRSARQALTTQLEDNLLKRIQELQKRMNRVGSSDASGSTSDELNELDQQLQSASAAEQSARLNLERLQAVISQQEAEIAKLQEEYNSVNAKAISLNAGLQEAELADDKYLEKRRAVITRKEDAANKLRDLGTLPTAELDKYSKIKRKSLVEELGKVHEKLRELQHVNKRVSSELDAFTKERETLIERAEENDRNDQTIHELIESLDAKKNEKILTTFKGVQKHFQEIFAELVPRGSASLILRRADDEDAEVETSKKGKSADVSSFIGVGVKASFTDAAQSGNKSLLSGGQRTILALALIFSIQRADPAPFYIMDEVDAALDPTHRSAVGAMVKSQAEKNSIQFITSSFWEELLEYGDKWFGVSLSNQVSSIEELGKDEAVAFVIAARAGDAQPSNVDNDQSAKKKAKLQTETPGSAPRVR